MSTPTPTLTGAYTCTHHNDQQRAACPVCLVTALTAERDHWQKIAVSASQEREHNANVAQALTAERDKLRADLATERAIVSRIRTQLGSPTYEQLRGRSIYDLIDELKANATSSAPRWKRECEWQAGVIAHAKLHHAERKEAIARAESAEREAFDWKKIARYEAARAERAEAELAAERARLNWLEERGPWESWFEPAREVSLLLRAPIRAAIDAAMKEGAK